jgi:hypothetical protein
MRRVLIFFCSLLGLFFPLSVTAQEAEQSLPLVFTRDFGFAAGGKIQGTFSLKVPSEGDWVRVTFLVDDQVVFVDDEPPFRYQFSTAEYSVGVHTLSAVGYAADGTPIYSPVIAREFISGEQAWRATRQFLIPLLVAVGILTLLGVKLPVIFGRRKLARPGEYGVAGGAVCPRCQLPYARNLFSPNMIYGKLERCPYCGKWAVVRRATRWELEEAEMRLAQREASPEQVALEEENFLQELEASRYEEEE